MLIITGTYYQLLKGQKHRYRIALVLVGHNMSAQINNHRIYEIWKFHAATMLQFLLETFNYCNVSKRKISRVDTKFLNLTKFRISFAKFLQNFVQ
jgi:hypothetical protein